MTYFIGLFRRLLLVVPLLPLSPTPRGHRGLSVHRCKRNDFVNEMIENKISKHIRVYLNPRPFSVFRHLRQWRGGGGWYDPPGDRPLVVIELRGKKQSTRLDEISRLHILFLVLGQHLT